MNPGSDANGAGWLFGEEFRMGWCRSLPTNGEFPISVLEGEGIPAHHIGKKPYLPWCGFLLKNVDCSDL